jgi:cytoskeletal protein RodZ
VNKNAYIGLACAVVALVAIIFFLSKQFAPQPDTPRPAPIVSTVPGSPAPAYPSPSGSATYTAPPQNGSAMPTTQPAAPSMPTETAETGSTSPASEPQVTLAHQAAGATAQRPTVTHGGQGMVAAPARIMGGIGRQ